MIYDCRAATMDDLARIWEKNIRANADDPRWAAWRDEYIGYNRSGAAQTYVVLCDGDPVGEGTLLFSPDCGAIAGRTCLADGAAVANINALRIEKAHEGKGHISALVRLMEADASLRGCTRLTIGVEAREERNQAIYRHWGYDRLILTAVEDGETVYYLEKDITASR